KVTNFVPESKGELLGLNLLRDIGTGEGPVEDGNGTRQHALHGLAGLRLGVRGPSDGHGGRAGDVGDNDGGTDVSRTVRLNPTKLKVSKSQCDQARQLT